MLRHYLFGTSTAEDVICETYCTAYEASQMFLVVQLPHILFRSVLAIEITKLTKAIR